MPVITGELRNKVDRVWEAVWSGGITNPIEVIQQITYLLFIRRLDELQAKKERQARVRKAGRREPNLPAGYGPSPLEPLQANR